MFADLGFKDAEKLQLKAELTRRICNRIKTLELTQVQAGGQLKISQPDVSKLMKGRYTGFSTDRLITFLNALKIDVDIVIRTRSYRGNQNKGQVRILEKAAA